MSRLRIASITYDWYPFDIRVRRMAEAAVAGGHVMDVYCLRESDEPTHETCGSVCVERLPIRRGFGQSLGATVLGWIWFLVVSAFAVTRQHLRARYDIVIVHNMPDFLVFAAAIPKLLGARVILDVQDVSPELMSAKASGRKRAVLKRLAIWQERVSTAFADHVITVGWPFEQLLLQRGVQSARLTNILNSADPRLFPREGDTLDIRRTPTQDSPYTLVYYGTLARRNGLDTAIRALHIALPNAPHLRLDIMGRGEELESLRALAAELDLQDHVRFSSPCPSEQIVQFALHGDAGIIPYRCDGFADLVLPTKAYELAWLRRPIIASATPAIQSMFRPQSISLCDAESPAAFAQAMVHLYANPDLRVQMVDSAAQDYDAFRWERMSERYLTLLDQLGTRPHPQPVAPAATQ